MAASKYDMQTVGYYLLSRFKRRWDSGNSIMRRLEKDIRYEEYHNFWKCRLPLSWYQEVLELLHLSEDDLLVEVARIKGNHAKDLHYHKISHAICIILGLNTGFNSVPYDSAVQINSEFINAYEDLECYFPVGCHHTFYGSVNDKSDSGDLYFISIQSPPLLTKDNDDFYWVHDR